jgi:hypothetical protein
MDQSVDIDGSVEVTEEAPGYAELLLGTNDLTIPHWDIPDYDPDLIHLALADKYNPELQAYKRKLQLFIESNIQYFSLPELAQILGVSVPVIIKLTPRDKLRRAGKDRTQSVIIWRSPEVLATDQMLFNTNKI